MDISVEKKIPIAFLIAIVVLLILSVFAYRSFRTLNDAINQEIHTRQVLENLDKVLIDMLNAETGMRGYIITGDSSFLDPYNSSVQESKNNIASLRQYVSDNDSQKQKVADLENLVNEHLGLMRARVETYQKYGEKPTAEIIGTGEGKKVMGKIRSLVAVMKGEEVNLLREREDLLYRSYSQSLYLISLGGLAGILLLSFAGITIYKEMKRRQKAEAAIKEANKNLESRIEERTKNLLISNDALSQSKVFNQAILDSLSAHIAVLDKKGIIKAVNSAWVKFSEENAREDGGILDNLGENYLNVCYIAGSQDSVAQHIYDELNKLLSGKVSGFSVEYPCHSKTEERWFLLNATALKTTEGGAVISHSNITERKKAEAELGKLFVREQNLREEAEAAGRMRDEFLATVSHELRNPLNAILGWGRMLQRKQLKGESADKAVETIVRNAESQNHLIEDLLDVSRIITGKFRLDVQPVKPSEFVEAAIDTLRPAADAKDIKIKTDIDYKANRINGDASRLQQVVWNLLSNAIKFTPKNGEVGVDVSCDESRILIEVSDTGVGIPQEFLPHVFDRFSQADASTIRKFGGLGLGLAIVRHITELHGGTVAVSSEGEGQGTKFSVKLPVLPVRVQAESVESVSKLEIEHLDSEANVNLEGVSILVVDDEKDTRYLLEQLLSHLGADVEIAGTAEEAYQKFTNRKTDILISDIGMPEEDGYSLMRRIRKLSKEQGGQTPAVALTAYARAQDRLQALTAGFQTHLTKPVEPDELAIVVGSLTGRLEEVDGDGAAPDGNLTKS